MEEVSFSGLSVILTGYILVSLYNYAILIYVQEKNEYAQR